jgi:ankyrin repeat protein
MKGRFYPADAEFTIGRIGTGLTHLWAQDKGMCGVRVRTHPRQAVEGPVTCPRCQTHLDAIFTRAVDQGHASVVETYLGWGAWPDADRNWNETALTTAIRLQRPDLILLLLDAGATVERRTQNGFTPLMVSAWSGCIESTQVLLNAGADLEDDYVSELFGHRGTPLVLAAKSGDLAMVRLLMEAGADITGGVETWGPLEWAVRTNHDEVVRFLLGFPHTGESLSRAINEAQSCRRPQLEVMIQAAIDRDALRRGMEDEDAPRRIM